MLCVSQLTQHTKGAKAAAKKSENIDLLFSITQDDFK